MPGNNNPTLPNHPTLQALKRTTICFVIYKTWLVLLLIWFRLYHESCTFKSNWLQYFFMRQKRLDANAKWGKFCPVYGGTQCGNICSKMEMKMKRFGLNSVGWSRQFDICIYMAAVLWLRCLVDLRHCRCRTSMAKAKISIPFSQRGPIPIQLEDSYTGNPTGCAVIDIIFPQGEQVSHHWCKTFSYQMFRKATATEVHTYTGLVYTNARKVSYLWYSCWWKPEQDWKMPLLLISDFRGSIS